MGRPRKITPNIEKAPSRLASVLDFLPEQDLAWDFFAKKFHNIATAFGYSKIETPLLENARLFHLWEEAGIGALVGFNEKDLRVAIKPTNFFGLVRSYLENHFYEREKVSKWFYYSPVVYTQAGQIRQVLEWGFQVFGEIGPIADVQLINLLLKLFTEIGLDHLSLDMNSSGCLECLPPYREVIKNFFKDKKYDLCENCLEDLERQPLRILACNNLSCSAAAAEAPVIVDFLCEHCRRHFISVLEGLDELSIAYNLSQKVVGNPYSTRSSFELHFKSPNGEIILGQGGHADDLVQTFGGPPAAALGFVGSMEALLNALDLAQVKYVARQKADVFLVPLGELAAKKSLRLFMDLWNHDIMASEFIGLTSIKTQLKLAESNKVAIALIMGQKEARDGTVILRDVPSGMQELFSIEHIIDEVKKRLGK